jgi:PKD repeat protein
MNVGYSSDDPVQVNAQVNDMMSRGIDGAVADWYGPGNTWINTATINLMNSAQASGGKFTFAVMEDGGALKACANTAGCDVTAKTINDLTYAYNTFENSPAYMRIGGRPVVFFFGTDAYNLDWTRIRTNTPGNPLFVFRNAGAFSKPESNGGFSWVGLSSDAMNMGLGYLDYFYSIGLTYTGETTFGSGYKGFNDTLASWGSNRILDQQCGQTWLATLAETGKYYSATNQLPALQLVTWNDYEEGTEIETGIDNCVTVTGGMAGNTISWSITGRENTIDHYTVFISLDGQNLMPVADVPAGMHSLDLSQYSFTPANYTLYVKAVGKPTITNKMSSAVGWTLAEVPPLAKLTVTPASGIAPVTVSADASGSTAVNGVITRISIDFGDGTVVSGVSASHSYVNTGTYIVTATVTDSFGGVSRATTTVTVAANQPPVARLSISPASGAVPVTVTADASASFDPDGKVASITINFGDGAVVNAATAAHTYGTPGTYLVTATVTDDRGAVSTATATASVTGGVVVSSPVAGATYQSPVLVSAKAVSSAPITCIKIYVDNVAAYSVLNVSQINTYVKMSAGTHLLVVQAWDSTGAVYKNSQYIQVQNGLAGHYKYMLYPKAY